MNMTAEIAQFLAEFMATYNLAISWDSLDTINMILGRANVSDKANRS